ncbi:MAG: undecaprenyldiphospho-muramoylpentapeptide beta-N-acetylglucosaminyltransferase [Gemmatimonadota bacterium]|nr:MAG: undecaprenyldiphospho-muramoylpentapeptide beta-N-acetylglucosaminyltransferase [Gemmatimonadota bacterium]
MRRVLIAGGGTGGHLMPALALAEALAREREDIEPVLVGAARGVEASLLPSRRFRHYLLPAEPIYRRAWWRNVRWPVVLARLLREGKKVLDAERPVLAVGTGGYASGPILLQARRRGVPLALQEQNAFPGLATRWLASRARQIHLGFPEAARHLRPGPETAVYEFGNPIAPPPEPRPGRHAARAELGVSADAPAVLVMGGSQGARSINAAVAEALEAGRLDGVTLLWSTGPGMFDACERYHRPPDRLVRPFWDPIAQAYGAVDLVVARAGAMTTAELCAWGLPSILVPLPSAAAGHQARNAEALARAGAALHLADAPIAAHTLAQEVLALLREPSRMAAMGSAAAARGHPNAAQRIARELLAIVS